MSTTINLSAATLCEYKTGTTSSYTIQDGQARITARVRWTWKNNKVAFYAEVTAAESYAAYNNNYRGYIFYGNPAGYVRLGVNGSYTSWKICLNPVSWGTYASGAGWIDNAGTYKNTDTKTINGTTSAVRLEIGFSATNEQSKTFNFTPSKTVMVSTTPSIEYERDGANVRARLKCATTRSSTAYSDTYTYVAKLAIGSASKSVTLSIPSTNTTTTSTSDWVVVTSTANTVSATVTINSSNGGAYSATRTATLNVPAMSGISCNSTGTLGQDFTINVTRYEPTFSDTLTYLINGATIGTIVSDLTGESAPYIWSAPAESLASYATSSPTLAITIRCTTYSSGTAIGSTDVTVTFTIPTSVAPSVGTITTTAINTNATVDGWGIYLQGYTKCEIDIQGSAGIYGSTITGYTVTVGGIAVNGTMSDENTAWNGTSGLIGSSGNVQVSITITDSRSRSSTVTQTITVFPYAFPSATNTVCHRTDQSTSSAESDDGTYIYMYATLNYSNADNHNVATMMIKYREADTGGSYSTPESVISNVGKAYGNGNISVAHSYEVVLTVVDSLNNGNTYTFSLPTGLAAFHIKTGGTGICLGGYSTHDNTVEIADRMGLVVGESVMGDTLPSTGIEGQIFFLTTNLQTVMYSFYNGSWHHPMLASYPVGAIYISTVGTSPAELFGGSWNRITNRFLFTTDTTPTSQGDYPAGSTGGEESVTLTTAQIPSHTHGNKTLTGWFDVRRYGTSVFISGTTGGIVTADADGGSNSAAVNTNNGSSTPMQRVTISATHEHSSVGGNGSHNNMPPYIAIYAWERVS